MKPLKIISALSLLMLTQACNQKKEDWTPLFNGKDLMNWKHVGNGQFLVENGQLKTKSGMGLLYYTPQKFENIELKVVYKGADKNNAGVFIRIPEAPTEAWMPVNKGYEVQIDDREDEYHKTGVLYSLTKAKATPGKAGDWNEMLITLKADSTIVHVNGVLVTAYKEGDAVPEKKETYEPDRGKRPQKGYIGLQNHGGDDVILFKEVSYRNLENHGN